MDVQSQPWARFAQAHTAVDLCAAWLDVLCSNTEGARHGVLLMAQSDGAYVPVSVWPRNAEVSHLRDVATDALRQREPVWRHDEQREGSPSLHVAAPWFSGEELLGAVVLELTVHRAAVANALTAEEEPAARIEALIRQIAWGSGWLAGLTAHQRQSEQTLRLRRGSFLLDAVLGMMDSRSVREVSLTMVNRLGQEFGAQQVHLGTVQEGKVRTQALSHAAWFEERANAVMLGTQAMQECVDQGHTIVWPTEEPRGIIAAHRSHAQASGATALASLPMIHQGHILGAVLLERDRPFEEAEIADLQRIVTGFAPVWALQEQARQGALARLWRSAREALAWLLGPRHAAIKLGLALATLLLLLLAGVPVPFRVSAQALVEGEIQRAAVTPFEAYLREAPARAGDTVRAGDVLAVLDDRDLQLEKARWESELEVAMRKEREAMAAGRAVDQRLAAAQAAQARAQLDLAQSKLDRVRITAPFDGTVVKGDLSQQLGSPLEQGRVLFELAPLDAWRVVLKVDERDIGHVKVGAQGELVLSSLPGQSWALKVSRITPVAVAEDGRNTFRVEARLSDEAVRLSPNMEGVAKVDVGQASPLWIWTRGLRDWARLALWRWLP